MTTQLDLLEAPEASTPTGPVTRMTPKQLTSLPRGADIDGFRVTDGTPGSYLQLEHDRICVQIEFRKGRIGKWTMTVLLDHGNDLVSDYIRQEDGKRVHTLRRQPYWESVATYTLDGRESAIPVIRRYLKQWKSRV